MDESEPSSPDEHAINNLASTSRIEELPDSPDESKSDSPDDSDDESFDKFLEMFNKRRSGFPKRL